MNLRRFLNVVLYVFVSLCFAQQALAQTVIYQDDFEGGTSGWSSNTTENAPMIGTNILGRFGGANPQVSRTFTLPAGATSLDVEFDLLRIDSWDFFNAGNDDGFSVLIDGNPLFSTTASFGGPFPFLDFPGGQGARSGTAGNVTWSHVPINPAAGSSPRNLDFRNFGSFDFDQIHRFTITVNNPGTTVDLTLLFDSDQGISDESVGYDNFLVTVTAPPVTQITAVAETFSSIDGTSGGVTSSVLASDTYDNQPATLSDVSLSVLSSTSSNVVLDPLTGLITVVPGTPAGSYDVEYEICEISAPANCSSVTETVAVNDPSSVGGGGGVCPAGAFPGPHYVADTEFVGFNRPQNLNNAIGEPEAFPVNDLNQTGTSFGSPFIYDLTGDPDLFVPGGEAIDLSFASFFGSEPTVTISSSLDNVNYTPFGTSSGPWDDNVFRFDRYTVPSGGIRYLQFSVNGNLRFDGAIYSTQCQAAAPETDLVTVKTLSSATATPNEGDTVTFNIAVTNNGPDDATGVDLTDLLPAGLTATAANGTVSAGTYDAATGLWTLGALANGDTATLTIEGTVDAGQGGNVITNTLASSASGDQTDPSTNGDDLTESVTVETPIPTIEAVDDDFLATPIAPGAASTTASIFDNDTLNDAAFAPADVTATVTNDGSLFGATLNPDGTVNVPAGIAPGIYELGYEICDVNDASLCDTAVVRITVQTTAIDTHNRPGTCGTFLSQGWVTHGKSGLDDSRVRFGSGDFDTDPYLYLPIERDADGRIISYFGTVGNTHSGALSAQASLPLVSTKAADSNHESEIQVIVYRLDGVPGSTLTADLDTRTGQEFAAYWIEDTAGNVISASDFQFTTSNTNIGGVGEALPLSFTAPSDGTAYLHAVIFDPSLAYGRPVISNYECPEPSLSMTKVANNPGPYLAGDVVTYTYTVTNDGNVAIRNVAITDTHNGSGPAPVPGNETLLTDAAPAGDSTDAATNNSWDVLAPGDILTFTGTYTITQTDAENL